MGNCISGSYDNCAGTLESPVTSCNNLLGYILGVAMTVLFSWRKTLTQDLPECLRLHTAKNGSELVGPSRALKAWQQLLAMSHATRSALVEMHDAGRVEIVGFGLATFVKKSFAESEVQNPQPGLNARIIESIAEGDPVVATYQEIRDSNTVGDLEQVILDTSWKQGALTAPQVDQVRVLLGQAYLQMYAGYRFSRILAELVDQRDFWHTHGQRSFRIIDEFATFRRTNPGSKWNADRALSDVTLETMRDDPHSVAAPLFQHHVPPQFGFARGEQELLELALEGTEDAGIAKSLFVSLAAIKRRWSSIFERVASISPELCPMDASGTRGVQKRQRILAYVRNHPEELRPFELLRKTQKRNSMAR